MKEIGLAFLVAFIIGFLVGRSIYHPKKYNEQIAEGYLKSLKMINADGSEYLFSDECFREYVRVIIQRHLRR